MRESPSEQFLGGIGGRVREMRQWRRMSLEELAARTEMSKTGLWQIETGRSDPQAPTLARLSIALGCKVDWIVFGAQNEAT